MWKDGKPEPFKRIGQGSDAYWEKLKGESRCDFVDRLHKKWEKIEQDTHDELVALRDGKTPTPIDDGEVVYVNVVWKGRNVRCETFLNVDLSDPKDGFKSSKIVDCFDKKMTNYDNLMSEERKTRAELLQHLVASKATDAKLAKGETTKEIIE